MARWTLTFALALGCAASYGPAPLEPERPIAELSEDEWQVLCRWVNGRRPDFPSGYQVCLDVPPEGLGNPGVTSIRFGDPVDFCDLRDQVRAETVGDLAEVVECHSRWREHRADFFRGFRADVAAANRREIPRIQCLVIVQSCGATCCPLCSPSDGASATKGPTPVRTNAVARVSERRASVVIESPCCALFAAPESRSAARTRRGSERLLRP